MLLPGLWVLFMLAAVASFAVALSNGRRVLGATLLVLVAAFALALAANAADFRDADGWIDCWPGCSAVQTATGAGLTYVPALGAALAVVTLVVAVVKRRR